MRRVAVAFYLFLVTNLPLSNCTSLSRSKTAQEYSVPPESIILPSDGAPESYGDLVEDMEGLRDQSKPSKFMQQEPEYFHQALDSNSNRSQEFFDRSQVDFNVESAEEQDGVPSERSSETLNSTWFSSSSPVMALRSSTSVPRWSRRRNNSNSTRMSKSGRRWFWGDPFRGEYVSTCYFCGLYLKMIPVTPYCKDIFDSDDWRMRTLARFARAECYNGVYTDYVTRKKEFLFAGYYKFLEEDQGLKTEHYAIRYIPGCFKRFLDIGRLYTQRGCRRYYPVVRGPDAIVDHRYGRLETMLRDTKEGCIVSPHASLVPYARGISLFARFHVCVCAGKYCNTVARLSPTRLLPLYVTGWLLALCW